MSAASVPSTIELTKDQREAVWSVVTNTAEPVPVPPRRVEVVADDVMTLTKAERKALLTAVLTCLNDLCDSGGENEECDWYCDHDFNKADEAWIRKTLKAVANECREGNYEADFFIERKAAQKHKYIAFEWKTDFLVHFWVDQLEPSLGDAIQMVEDLIEEDE
jgi:hypothetical protein